MELNAFLYLWRMGIVKVKFMLQVLQKMQESGCLPDTYTYSSLIEACTWNGENELGLKVYRRALLEVILNLQVDGIGPNY